MSLITSFSPISGKGARILILGSMPGIKSLEAQQYYAHPQNQFWKLMGDLVGAGRDLPYKQRLKILKEKNIAVWDVFQCCIRPGSLDSKITNETVNDFPAFFKKHPHITHVFFDSGKAEEAFHRLAMPLLEQNSFVFSPRKRGFYKVENSCLRGKCRNLYLHRIPSPSPTHAGMKYEAKLKEWKKILKAI
jgi:double-stranded uracil-DNA glycosylase